MKSVCTDRRSKQMGENYVTRKDEKGSINISEDVIAVMVSAAIAEVDGVAGPSNTIASELVEFLGKKSVQKGIKVQFDENNITIDTIITVRFGSNITEVAQKVQSEIATSVSNMTGMQPTVNVHVSGIAFDR